MATNSAPDTGNRSIPRYQLITPGQFCALLGWIGLLALIAGFLKIVQPQYWSAVARDPQGAILLWVIPGLVFFGAAVHIVGCALVNAKAPPTDRTLRGRRFGFSAIVVAAILTLVVMPAAFLLLWGPAVLDLIRFHQSYQASYTEQR